MDDRRDPSRSVMVKDINSGSNSSQPSEITDVSGTAMFTADDGTNGFELWESNGMAAGTTTANIYTGSGVGVGARSPH